MLIENIDKQRIIFVVVAVSAIKLIFLNKNKRLFTVHTVNLKSNQMLKDQDQLTTHGRLISGEVGLLWQEGINFIAGLFLMIVIKTFI